MKTGPLLVFISLASAFQGCAPSLARYKAMGREGKIDSTANVIAVAAITINAPAEIIWNCLVDAQAWPDWDPKVKSVQASGPLAVGTKFTWGPSFPKIESEVVYSSRDSEIVWIGRMLHAKAIHRWILAANGNATLVTTEESMDGAWLRLFFGRKKLRSDLEAWLRYLKTQTEGQYMGARENSAFLTKPPDLPAPADMGLR